VFLEFSRSRGQEVPRQRLQGFQGTIQTDAYEVYSALERKHCARLRRIGCLTHARRRFYQALQESFPEALRFILQIRELYRIEDQVRFLAPDDRYQIRRQQAPPIWGALKEKAEEPKTQAASQKRPGHGHYLLPG
jgi:transposase